MENDSFSFIRMGGGFMYDIIIVGCGPAGMTAALYALRSNKKVLILEARSYGGQIVNAHKIENYPGIMTTSGFEYATTLYEQIKKLGAEIKYETVIRIDENKNITTSKNTYQAKAIIIATGAENKKLGIANESKFIGKGVSYCATCDGNFYKNKIVAVVGGGNTALEDALYLADLARKVYLIHRREDFRGEEQLVDELKHHSNVEFILNATVEKLNGENQLESIDIKDISGNVSQIAINGLFIAVGQAPKNEIFANVIQLNENGYIVAIDDVHTNISGIYVAGDARVKNLRQLTTAVGDGALAATTAIREMK